jgi:tartrate dehydratase beta subunit/fumarate hydratase class I family protein
MTQSIKTWQQRYSEMGGAFLQTKVMQDEIDELRAALNKQTDQSLLGDIIGCFDAAIAEGLYEAISNTEDERLKDLLERRVMHAYLYAIGPQKSVSKESIVANGPSQDAEHSQYGSPELQNLILAKLIEPKGLA